MSIAENIHKLWISLWKLWITFREISPEGRNGAGFGFPHLLFHRAVETVEKRKERRILVPVLGEGNAKNRQISGKRQESSARKAKYKSLDQKRWKKTDFSSTGMWMKQRFIHTKKMAEKP